MKSLLHPTAYAALIFGSLVGAAMAGPHKEEYWDGRCKVERKWDKGGEYKEKRKCKGKHAHVRHEAPYYAEPQPVYVAPRPGVIVERPAVVIQPQIVIRP
ncbi:hypothetical protein ACFJIS_17795 [Variovorax boronicumulans]|uniref:hypothetical protein n=1 Tax=Variovorax boronicumulans TaxID=436515 RepID=UPI0036F436F2